MSKPIKKLTHNSNVMQHNSISSSKRGDRQSNSAQQRPLCNNVGNRLTSGHSQQKQKQKQQQQQQQQHSSDITSMAPNTASSHNKQPTSYPVTLVRSSRLSLRNLRQQHHMLIKIILMSTSSVALLLIALMALSSSNGQSTQTVGLVQGEPLTPYYKYRTVPSPGDSGDPMNEYYHQALNLLYKRQSLCISRGKSCDHRPDDCCQDSACRCNLWGTNCKCYRMGLFQKWGKK